MDPDAVELRVLGCLIEKQRTTPDQYPLSLNALRLACNQSTNREPVVDYDEHTVREAAQRLGRRRWSRLASSSSSRTAKYRHLLDEALVIGQDELALLCVLLLRGPQTPGELKTRTERLHRFADLDELHFALSKLIDKGHAVRLERRPGQKEERYDQLLGGEPDEDAPYESAPPAAAPAQVAAPAPVTPPPADDARVTALEQSVAALREELALVRAELRTLSDELGA